MSKKETLSFQFFLQLNVTVFDILFSIIPQFSCYFLDLKLQFSFVAIKFLMFSQIQCYSIRFFCSICCDVAVFDVHSASSSQIIGHIRVGLGTNDKALTAFTRIIWKRRDSNPRPSSPTTSPSSQSILPTTFDYWTECTLIGKYFDRC